MVSHEDFRAQNIVDWKRVIDLIFPIALPGSAIWVDANDIIAVLKQVGSIAHVNHAFFPDGGGLDLTDADIATEDGLIMLNFDKSIYYAKPAKLLFESFSDDDNYQWNYFRLELASIKDTGTYDRLLRYTAEELLELEPNVYVNRMHWDEGSYRDAPLPDTARVVTRLLGGCIVIFQKTSVYNQIKDTYDGRHNKVDSSSFREYIADLRQAAKSYGAR